MSEILDQLGLDRSFFYIFTLFGVLFVVLSRVYFKPFFALIQARHRRTVEDREKAEALLAQAEKTISEYKKQLTDERTKIKAEVDALIAEAKTEEARILSRSREEAKKITQAASEKLNKEGEELKKQLEGEVEVLAQAVSNKLLGSQGGGR